MSVKTATWTAWTPPAGKSITGYKIYSDKDGEVASVGLVLTTPITLSDGVSHNVTCRAVYDDASLGLVSNVEVVDLSSIIVFQDDFAGGAFGSEWEVSGTGGTAITQNEEVNADCTLNSTGYDVSLDTVLPVMLAADPIKVLSFNLKNVGIFGDFLLCLADAKGVLTNITQRVGILSATAIDNINSSVRVDNVGTTGTQVALSMQVYKTVKVVINGLNASVYYWNGSWILLDNYTFTTTWDAYISMRFRRNLDQANSVINIDNLFICNADFSTQYPT